MPLDTFKDLQDRVMRDLALTQQSERDLVKDLVNEAEQDFMEERNWRFTRREGRVTTVGPYKEGTISVSGTTVTGVGTTFTSAMVGRKLALEYNAAPYRIATFTSTTSIELERAWVGTEPSGSAYVIYQDVYPLATDCRSYSWDKIVLEDRSGYRLRDLTQAAMWVYPRGEGRPTHWAPVEPDPASTDNLRVRVGLWSPDQVYSIRYEYFVKQTEMSGDADVPMVPKRWRKHLIHGAKRKLYEMDEYSDVPLSQLYEAKWTAGLLEARGEDLAARPKVVSIDPVDSNVLGNYWVKPSSA